MIAVKNPEDLALAFERCADEAARQAQQTASNRRSAAALAEAACFKQCADMVRTVEFVGWNYKEKMQ